MTTFIHSISIFHLFILPNFFTCYSHSIFPFVFFILTLFYKTSYSQLFISLHFILVFALCSTAILRIFILIFLQPNRYVNHKIRPGSGYICYRCRQPGHHIRNCPTIGVRIFAISLKKVISLY